MLLLVFALAAAVAALPGSAQRGRPRARWRRRRSRSASSRAPTSRPSTSARRRTSRSTRSTPSATRADLEDLALRVRESGYLADRVVVLTPRPIEVQKTVSVDLPAPRDDVGTKELPEFGHLRAHVYRAIERREGATVGAAASAAAPTAPETRGQ